MDREGGLDTVGRVVCSLAAGIASLSLFKKRPELLCHLTDLTDVQFLGLPSQSGW